MYSYRTELGDPLLEGDQLGDLQDEYPHHNIREFWALAPKAYALVMDNKVDGKEEHVLKLRSITLDADTAQKVTTDRVREMVEALYDPAMADKKYQEVDVHNNFRALRAGGIETVPMKKRLRPSINKGMLRENFRIDPFGW